MKKHFLILAFLLVCGVSFAQDAKLPIGDIEKPVVENAGVEILVSAETNEVVAVKPAGWKWGESECPPNFIILKVSEMGMKDAKKYEEGELYEIDKSVVDTAKQLPEGKIQISTITPTKTISISAKEAVLNEK